MEFSDQRRRGFWTSWPQIGVPVGLALSSASILLFKSLYPGEAFQVIGWRIPFLLSTTLVALGLYIRLRIPETPAFLRLVASHRPAVNSTLTAFRHYWREIALTALIRTGEQAPYYIFTTFVLSYGTLILHLDSSLVYISMIAASGVSFCMMPCFGALSDRVGRRRTTISGALAMMACAFPFFLLLNTGIPLLVILALVLALCPHACLYGPQSSLIAERFPTYLRYTGASLGYQLASIVAGGPAPIIATYLLTRSLAQQAVPPAWALIALYIIAAALVTLLAALPLKEYAGRATREED